MINFLSKTNRIIELRLSVLCWRFQLLVAEKCVEGSLSRDGAGFREKQINERTGLEGVSAAVNVD